MVILLDGGKTVCEQGNTYDALRKAAFYFAQSMLLYNPATDRLGIFMLGSAETKNDLNDGAEDGGYEHIEQIHPLTKTSFEAIKRLSSLEPGQDVSDYIDALYVAGDHVVTRVGKAKLEKHIVLFTDGKAKGNEDFESELNSIANVLRKEKTKLTVIMPGYTDCDVGGEEFGTEQDLDEKKDSDVKEEEKNPEEGGDDDEDEGEQRLKAFEPESLVAEMKERKAVNTQIKDKSKRKSSLIMRNETLLRRVALASNGYIYSLEDALLNMLQPKPKSKKAVPKYSGTLSITDKIQIPVKIFSQAMKAGFPSAKRLSWERSKEMDKMVPIFDNVTYVTGKSKKDVDEEDELMGEELVSGYAYGPQWVKVDEATKINMSIMYEKSLSVIGFVPDEAIPIEYYMGSVDVVVAMSNVHRANCAMQALVSAMYSERCGMIARYVARSSAKFVYLWPEIDDEGKYLYMVEIPTAEDLRSYPFNSLEGQLDNETPEAAAAMNAHIDAMNLEPGKQDKEAAENEDESDEDEEASIFDPATLCNPSIHVLNASKVKRAMDGVDGKDIPAREEWVDNILKPFNFVKDQEVAERSIEALKNYFHVHRVEAKSRRKAGSHWVAAPTGDMDLSAFMPPIEEEETKENEDGAEEQEKGNESDVEAAEVEREEEVAIRDKIGMMAEDAMSNVTVFDIGEESPVADFQAMAQGGLFVAALELMETMILRLVRKGDFFQAVECLATVRATAIEKKQGREFNGFLYRLFRRASQMRGDSVHLISFFREIEAQKRRSETLAVVTKKEDSTTCPRVGELAVKDCSKRVEILLNKSSAPAKVSVANT